MAISLYDLSVTAYLQGLNGVSTFMEKGLAHCQANGIDLGEVLETRLYPDMRPFSYQIVSVTHHSRGAIEAVQAGVFSPPAAETALDYAGLQKLVADARTALAAVKRETVDALEGRDVAFQLGDRQMPFVVQDFLMSFSLPNFYFHATTAYDILRMKGAPIGKRDYMGGMRLKA